ncbi:RING finger protein 151 [Polypterus senegalus]|uniref:RING finger protein 151 n=1 Tax=Polypterus senegalus TaxID=55291 RepID=UPI0019646991|nr:RING finger protein 151 [Polypterus senegalus]
MAEARLVTNGSGGYDLEQFVEVPDPDLICTICHGVMRCPVRIVCKHIFCKRCILQWLRRHESCPYCRKPVHKEMLLVMYRLCRSISRLQIKCKNHIHGCLATFPLAEQCKHLTSCGFEVTGCTNEGCEVEVLRKDLPTHVQSCEFRRRPCSMGCGEILTHQTLAQHNCYRALKREFDAQQRTHKAIAAKLKKKMEKMQTTMLQMKRQISLICESLEVMDQQEDEEEEEDENTESSGHSSSSSGETAGMA